MKSLYASTLSPKYDVIRTWEKNDETTVKMTEVSIVPKEVADALCDQNKAAVAAILAPIVPDKALAAEKQAEAAQIDSVLV